MIETLTTSQATDLVYNDDCASWTLYAAKALVEHYERFEDMTGGTPIELDITAIRCDWSSFGSLEDFQKQYYSKEFRDLDHLREYTTVLEYPAAEHINEPAGIIVHDFTY